MPIWNYNEFGCDKCHITKAQTPHTDILPVVPEGWQKVEIESFIPAKVVGTDVNKQKLGPVRHSVRVFLCPNCVINI